MRHEQQELFTVTGEEREVLKQRIIDTEGERRIMLDAAKAIAAPYKERAKELDATVHVLLAQLGETVAARDKWITEAREDYDQPAPRSIALAGDLLAKKAAAEALAKAQGKRSKA